MPPARVLLPLLACAFFAGCGPVDPEAATFRAAQSGDVKLLTSLLKKDPSYATLSDRSFNGRDRTPLHSAASRAVAELLVQNGANVKAKDKLSWTPLHTARNAEVADYLISQGAEITARSDRKLTPLHVTADAGVATLLLKAGAPLNDQAGDFTPLHYQITQGHTEVVELLLQRGAQTTMKARLKNRTLMHVAASEANADIVKLLAGRGLSVNARDEIGSTPLHEAAYAGKTDVVEALVALGAEVNPHFAADAAEHSFSSGDGRMRERSLANATPLDVAKNDETRAVLQRLGGVSGVGGKLPDSVDVNEALRKQVMAADRLDYVPQVPRSSSGSATAASKPAPTTKPAGAAPKPVTSSPPPAPTPAATPGSSVEYLTLRGIGGSAARRIGLVHSGIKTYTLAVGDSVILQTPAGDVDLRCIEIRSNSVVIQVAGEATTRELKMR